MNKNVKRVLAGLTMMVSVGLVAGCGSTEQVGYVDMQKIMTESQKGQDTRSKLEAKYNEINARLAQEQSAGQDANAMMQSKQKAEQEMQAYQVAMINDFRNSVDSNVQAIAKDKNITAVVEKNALISGGVDLTEDVLTKMGKVETKEQAASTNDDAKSDAGQQAEKK